MPYVKKINGYTVKDGEARQYIDELRQGKADNSDVERLSQEVDVLSQEVDVLSQEVDGMQNVVGNPNLLINGDFRNPVNQRGATSHNGGGKYGYTLDRWCSYNPHSIEVVTGSYTKITSGQYDMQFAQFLEKPLVNGQTYTISACVNGNIVSHTFTGGSAFENENFIYLIRNENVSYVSLTVKANTTLNVEWIKLEQGSIATPFIPRLYAEELDLCQRYYQILSLRIAKVSSITTDTISFIIAYQTKMRIEPTMEIGNDNNLQSNGLNQSGFTFSNGSVYINFGFINAKKSNHGLSFTTPLSMTAYLRLDAEIY